MNENEISFRVNNISRLQIVRPEGGVQWKLFLKFYNIHRKTSVLESLLNKVAGLQVLRTPILKNICERLLSAKCVFKNLKAHSDV